MTSTLPQTETRMRAVVKTGAGAEAVRIMDVPVPAVGEGLVRVRVTATGICGTDVHVAHDDYAHEAPVVMGHEITGVVDVLGEGVSDEWLDRSVACETYFSVCETCQWCREGRRNLCPNRRSLGSYENGGFAEFVVLPARNLHALPEWLPAEAGALAEPLACVTQCLLDPAAIQVGDRVLVTGPGAMGQLAGQVARAMGGVVTIAGLDRDRERLAIAEAAGLTTTTLPIHDETFDVVLECSGSNPGATTALAAVRRGGRYVQIGIFGREVHVPFDQILYKELLLSSGFASTPRSWMSAMKLISQRRVDLVPLITKRVPIAQFDAALQAAERGEGLKTVVVPDLS